MADHSNVLISSLEPQVDRRTLLVPVAGTAALLVAKAHKLHERLAAADAGRADRLRPKDASDVIRLMQADSADQIGARLRTLADDEMAGASVRDGVGHLRELFGRRRSPGVDLAVQALQTAVPEAVLRTLAPAYMALLLDSYNA
ncbi:hypothetical protein [Polymorphospora rubra]|uniref:hypothetical protein n=1 Tax=Polymorphospora rubra TaxID=338584 RepID=UPI001BB31258|nr:hypothetical protein [Polymorphospora rubra]